MNHQTVTEVSKHIDPQEKILWSGKPRQGIVFRGSDILLAPFALFFGGLAFFLGSFAMTLEEPFFAALASIVSGTIAIHDTVGYFYVDAKQRGRTFYAVTSERIVIISNWRSQKVRFISLPALREISVTESWNGTGTVFFGPFPRSASLFNNMQHWSRRGGSRMKMRQYFWPWFYTIDNPEQVHQIILDAQKNACNMAFGFVAAELPPSGAAE